MTVVSSLDPSDSKTPVNREILMALFTPLGKCRFMDEKVSRDPISFFVAAQRD
jgi:pyrroline-5-carboxylate reductase